MDWIIAHQLYILLGVAATGFCVLAFFIHRLNKKVARLLGENDTGETNETYQLIHRIVDIEESLRHIDPRLKEVESIGNVSIQKVGFIRFNPFEDTGGDNSFALALLDKKSDGVLISSLYLRDGMRIYSKKVEGGKTRYPLLEEEKKVLEEAIKK